MLIAVILTYEQMCKYLVAQVRVVHTESDLHVVHHLAADGWLITKISGYDRLSNTPM